MHYPWIIPQQISAGWWSAVLAKSQENRAHAHCCVTASSSFCTSKKNGHLPLIHETNCFSAQSL
jgi:hypothetical protein